ncbi:alpha/beta fold hydrolase [Nocardia barduliensis]|uniref:alpha/beta fold hydrolase n=1 Tax=Nocardia barduliensis TaxID=2736643 RepID=UPI001573D7B5|nr:alpha/beta hydrolase [Nocardia barduliensis]
MNSDQQPNGIVKTYQDAPTRTIEAGGITFAYRELGPCGGIPVVFFVHLAGNLDNWDPRIIDPIAAGRHVIAFDNRIANGDHDRMVPSPLSEDLHRRIPGSDLIIYPGSGHGAIFQFHDKFAPIAAAFLAD